MISPLLIVAQDYYKHPGRFPNVSNASAALPPGITELLGAFARELADDNIASTAATLNVSTDDCHAAALFLIRQLLLDAGDNYYRILGVAPDADGKLIKLHYQHLMRLFHPDKDLEQDSWGDVYAAKINEAYNALRNPAKRAAYDEQHAAEPFSVGAGVRIDALYEMPAVSPPVPASGGRAFAWMGGLPGFGPKTWGLAGALVVVGIVAIMLLGRQAETTAAAQAEYAQQQARLNTATPKGVQRPDLAAIGYGEGNSDTAAVAGESASESAAVESPQAPAVANSTKTSTQNIEAVIQAQVREAKVAVLGSRPVRQTPAVPKKATTVPVAAKVELAPPVTAPATAVVADEPEETAIDVAVALKPDAPSEVAILPEPEPEPEPADVAMLASVPAARDVFEVGGQTEGPVSAQAAPQPTVANAAEPAAEVGAAQSNAEKPIELRQLSRVMSNFITTYNAGAATALSSLFTADARTTDATGRRGIYRDYKAFFSQSDKRRMELIEFSWPAISASKAMGVGTVGIYAETKNDKYVYTGTLRMTVGIVKRSEALQISEMYHAQLDD